MARCITHELLGEVFEMKRLGGLFVILLVALAVVLSAAPLGAGCIDFPNTRVVDPGNDLPSYCGATGDGCVYCTDIIIVVVGGKD